MSLRDHPFAHTGLKIVSVALAVLLWMMVSSQRASVERGLRIPLELQNLPENLEMVEPPQEAVDVRVRGTADALGRIAPGDLVAAVDLSAAQPGRRLFHLSPERVKAPFAVVVTQVTPSSVAIRFEPSATRIVAVVPSVEGEPAPGFIVGKISADPATVEIVGPESLLRRVTEAITEPLWLGSAKADVQSTVIVGVADEGVRVKSAKTAVVSVAIVPAPAERQLSAVVRARNLGAGLRATITPPSVSVRVRGTKEAIAKIRDASIVAYVDLDGIGRGDYGLPVRLVPAAGAGVGVDQLDPTIVSIHVE
jgi:YbbR domain-containing protein